MRQGVVARLATSIVAITPWSGVVAQAQNPAESPVAVPEVVVTGVHPSYVGTDSTSGTKTSTPIIETPQAITVVTAAQMEAQNAQTLNAAMYYSAGVTTSYIGYDTQRTYFLIRGFDETSRGVFQDGLKLFGANILTP